MCCVVLCCFFFFSSRRRHTRCALVTGVQTCALPILVCDVGPPPPARLSKFGHASTLAFELSDGPQRIIVNCGGHIGGTRRLPDELVGLMKSTAAHSTVEIGRASCRERVCQYV